MWTICEQSVLISSSYLKWSPNNEMQLPGSVADFVIPADNFQLILRFIKKVLPRTPVPVITTTSIPVMATTDGNQAREFYIACMQVCIFVCIHLCMYIRFVHSHVYVIHFAINKHISQNNNNNNKQQQTIVVAPP